ncbi:unnamed protein product [Cuscuta campestris]|uniref:Pyruvate carboxyltransferase domain-containing protein n=1 Tax=Cuscuta campestris TaxID=132261 RepID=A0A484KM51_9ASTE|nr:unnamed protein product [Cuscuta campestris]
MKAKLKMTKEQVMEKATSMVSYARSLGCPDVEFSPEDAGRSDREFLYQILGEVIRAGATTLNIPDTVGYTIPSEFGQLIADIKANTPGIENVIISTHCHNDLGLATTNTLAGACAGARQLEVTINGVGERAGNALLEEMEFGLVSEDGVVLGTRVRGVSPDDTILDLKARIFEMNEGDAMVSRQTLYFGGEELEVDRKISDYPNLLKEQITAFAFGDLAQKDILTFSTRINPQPLCGWRPGENIQRCYPGTVANTAQSVTRKRTREEEQAEEAAAAGAWAVVPEPAD